MGEDRLSAGRVGRAHGLDGSFYVTGARGRLLTLGASVGVAGRQCEIVRRAGTDQRPIVRLDGHDSREAADALRGEDLWVDRSDLPALGEDEWYAEDLVGCAVSDGPRTVGVVRRMLAYPSCDLLEVQREGAGDLLVPLVDDAVRSVDIARRAIDVDLAFLGED